MKLIIDIPEENYEEMCEYGNERVDFDLKRMIQNGTPIPDNATNGDCVRKLFCKGIYRISVRKNVSVEFKRDWWYAPYQKGGK